MKPYLPYRPYLPYFAGAGADLALVLGYGYDFQRFPADNDLLIAGPYVAPQGLRSYQLTLAVILSATLYGAL
jgi:hypothetical protein